MSNKHPHLKQFIQSRLSREERLVLILHYYENLNLAEIALVMELSESRVKSMHQSLTERITHFMDSHSQSAKAALGTGISSLLGISAVA